MHRSKWETHLDVGLDVAEVMGSHSVNSRLLSELQITQGGQLKSQALQGVVGLVHHEHYGR